MNTLLKGKGFPFHDNLIEYRKLSAAMGDIKHANRINQRTRIRK
jgi:hypothetical protein